MGEKHRPRRRQKPRVDIRLLFVDVDARSEQRPGLERRCERRLVDHGPSGGVHQDGRRLHESEAAGVDQVGAVFGAV